MQLILSTLHRDKAYGEDLLTPAIAKAAPWAVTKVLWPLIHKVCSTIQAPLAWKGGALVDLWKRKASAAHCCHSRGILVADWSSKILPKYLRAANVDKATKFMHDRQCGGRPRRSIDFVSHASQSHFARARQLRRPAACIFFDVVSAFYSVYREAIFGWGGTD